MSILSQLVHISSIQWAFLASGSIATLFGQTPALIGGLTIAIIGAGILTELFIGDDDA